MSHEWPTDATKGDTRQLLKVKPYFRDEIRRGELGSKNLSTLLQHLAPNFWLSAHLHVEFDSDVKTQSGKIVRF